MVEKIGAAAFLIVFMLVFAAFGGYFVTMYNDQTVTIANAPTTLGTLNAPGGGPSSNVFDQGTWVWNCILFIFGLSGFVITGVPIIFSFIAFVVDALWIIILILVIRGN